MGTDDRHPGAILFSGQGVLMSLNQLRGWLVRLTGFFNRNKGERELQEELDSHLQMHIDDNLRAGMTAAEARRHALIKLGGVTQVTENYRERRGLPLIETALEDLR